MSPYFDAAGISIKWRPMLSTRRESRLSRIGIVGLLLAAGLLAPGCATRSQFPVPRTVAADLSPAPEYVAPREAWQLAEAFVAANPGCEILVGSGDSMLPLYRDRTVLIVRAMGMAELKRGMSVVFFGDRGRPVVHILVEKTARGWIAMGMGNQEPDDTRVQRHNYIGTVIRAFTPNASIAAHVADGSVDGRMATVEPRPNPVFFASGVAAGKVGQ